jgi:ATP-dependent DNA helicase RecQ
MSTVALSYLQRIFGPDATFREGQSDAITELAVNRSRLLLVQRTGWGKSIVYFIATRMLRDRGAGPSLLISPLLSLMRNQIEMAERCGILKTARIDSSNQANWETIRQQLVEDKIDMLLISPERLANWNFMREILPGIKKGIGFFIVDEAHCISDWGHDFRPDYRRIVRVINLLPKNIPVLATTATANNRVMNDVSDQLGKDLKIMRGPLARKSLALQNIQFNNNYERLAWLLFFLKKVRGSGIIYCLTKRDTEIVSAWLQKNGINVRPYNADLDTERREMLEQALVHNRVKALAATVALGMGFDKPDLRFVVHFQKPASVIHYYQQVGRAGRSLKGAYGILLSVKEDDEINEYFITDAFPPEKIQRAIVTAIEKSPAGMSIDGLQKEVNVRYTKIEEALRMLEIDGVVSKRDRRYYRTLNKWNPDLERIKKVTELRFLELKKMNEYLEHTGCLMKYLCNELDDPYASECGRCSVCAGREIVPAKSDPSVVQKALYFIRGSEYYVISPRSMWPSGIIDPSKRKKIKADWQNLEGRAMCFYGDPGPGRLVAECKYKRQEYCDELVDSCANFILKTWKPDPFPEWVTAIPSKRTQNLVPDFAERLAKKLNLPFKMILVKTSDTELQKRMNNSYQQCRNIYTAFQATQKCPCRKVLLVDDIVDSGWTLTVAGKILKENGCGSVVPFTIAAAPSKGDI